MHQTIKTLLASVNAPVVQEQQEAAFHLAMLLEKATRPSDEIGFYESILPVDLLAVQLTARDQRFLLDALVVLPNVEPILAQVFWAIGKATPQAGATAICSLADRFATRLTPEATYQAIIALEVHLDAATSDSTVSTAIRSVSCNQLLDRASSLDDERVAQRLQSIRRRIRKLAA